ncbi:hypothetical protein Maq22A_1p38485 (plasmid) [Methylobacterium aquaticum]|uniref:Uncharacterized protein n=1 Tax=Methylobacterium aquaticum TaxID=270351 RepID=A0A1Y0ZH32_9HYPH|nr:hypothetical protein Maq22A_1p38485 [Methylobacterium aquaticum]
MAARSLRSSCPFGRTISGRVWPQPRRPPLPNRVPEHARERCRPVHEHARQPSRTAAPRRPERSGSRIQTLRNRIIPVSTEHPASPRPRPAPAHPARPEPRAARLPILSVPRMAP